MGFLDSLNPFSGILSGGMQLVSNIMQGNQAEDRQQQAQAFNAQQADVSRQFTANEQSQAEEFNSNEAMANRNFQQYMSNTAYERGVADMKAAGINPILAAGSGGASSPTGSMGSIGGMSGATAQSPTPAPTVGMMQGVLNSALDAQKAKPQIDALEQDATNRMYTGENIKSDTANKDATNSVIYEQARKTAAEADIAELGKKEAQRQAKQAEIGLNELSSTPGQILETGAVAGKQLHGIVSSAADLVGMLNPVSRLPFWRN